MTEDDSAAARSVRALGWPSIPVSPNSLTANAQLFSGACLLRGWTLQNGNAASQTFQILDGNDASGLVVAVLTLATNARSQGPVADSAVLIQQGIFLIIPGAPLQGAIYLTPLDGMKGLFPHGKQPNLQ